MEVYESGEFKELLVRFFRFLARLVVKEIQIDYQIWREKWVDLKEGEKKRILEEINSLTKNPSFKIILNVDPADPISYLFLTIESIKSQIYSDWVLQISNLNELDSNISQEIYSMDDDRITFSEFLFFDLETKDWIIELDVGVNLHEAALADVAFSIEDNPEIKIIYGDHDHVNASGVFLDPHMKPIWNAELFSSINYMAPFIICEKSIWNDY